MLELIKTLLFGSSDPGINQAFIGTATALGGLAQMAMGYDWGGKRKKALAKARAAYNEQKEIFNNLETKVDNAYEGMTNQYEGMENTFEDLTVNQQQARFERQSFERSQANIMQNLRGAAGGSGVAGLAQALSNQAATQAQRQAAFIGQQEAKNKLLAAQQAAKIDQLQAGEGSKIQQLQAAGAQQAQITSMQMEQSKQGTILGMDAQAVTGAQQAVQAGQQLMAKGIGDVIGGVAGMYEDQTGIFKPRIIEDIPGVEEKN
jgi:hypothetical protein